MEIINDISQFSADQMVFPYKEYHLVTSYEYNSGLIQIPIAPVLTSATTPTNPLLTPLDTESANGVPSLVLADRPESVTIKVAEAWGRKKVTFRAVRQTIPPVLPDPTPANANEILLAYNIELKAPSLAINGQCYEWTAEGTIVYALLAPYWTSDGLTGGSTPLDLSNSASNAIPYPEMYDGELGGVPVAMTPDPAQVILTTLEELTDA